MERCIRLLGVALLCCGLLSGCGTDGRSLPFLTAASPTLPPTAQPPRGPVTVAGVVSEVVSGHTVPLEGVHVEDSERHFFVQTGADGSYTIADVAVSSFGGAYIFFA